MGVSMRDFYPPILGKLYSKLSSLSRGNPLFDGDEEMFKRLATDSHVYGEYGMGASTRWVLENTNAKVLAVDTSRNWVDHVRESNSSRGSLDAMWVDVGPIGEWGRPVSYAHRLAFRAYIDALWTRSTKPDLILVDGRFRVACFLHTLLNATAGSKIIFDDYTNRPHYHVVEEFVIRAETCGRQCLFIVPADIDREAITDLRNQFLFVID